MQKNSVKMWLCLCVCECVSVCDLSKRSTWVVGIEHSNNAPTDWLGSMPIFSSVIFAISQYTSFSIHLNCTRTRPSIVIITLLSFISNAVEHLSAVVYFLFFFAPIHLPLICGASQFQLTHTHTICMYHDNKCTTHRSCCCLSSLLCSHIVSMLFWLAKHKIVSHRVVSPMRDGERAYSSVTRHVRHPYWSCVFVCHCARLVCDMYRTNTHIAIHRHSIFRFDKQTAVDRCASILYQLVIKAFEVQLDETVKFALSSGEVVRGIISNKCITRTYKKKRNRRRE